MKTVTTGTRQRLQILVVITLLMVGLSNPAAADIVRLTSLEWPPYSGEALKDGGTSIQEVRRIFDLAGLDLDVAFLPWKRAVALAEFHPDYAGVVPEYHAARRDMDKGGTGCRYSLPFGISPIGFAYRTDKVFDWGTYDDLKPFRFGVVSGYINEEKFDDMVLRNELIVDGAMSDEQNIRKLLAGRVDAIVIDKNVLQHILSSMNYRSDETPIAFHAKLLAEQKLFICFSPDKRFAPVRDAFNRVLREEEHARQTAISDQ